MTSPTDILRNAYQQAQHKVDTKLTAIQQDWCKTIVDNAESQKAVLAVVITSLTKKIEDPNQDVRQHQKKSLTGGYSGRTFDTSYITPFLLTYFPRYAMRSGSGWLTRTLEQPHSYTLDYPGKIGNSKVKKAFLEILNDVEFNHADPEEYLINVFTLLLKYQETQMILSPSFRSNSELTILGVVSLLEQHFFASYRGSGAARLPVIAIYALYSSMISHPRYLHKQLLPLKSHTTSDTKSSSLGDIEVVDSGNFFEVVEVRHRKSITLDMVQIAYEKIKPHPINRYYLLTTHHINTVDTDNIMNLCEQIYQEHGCEIIVNGLINSIKYYLRLIDNTTEFVQLYTQNLVQDYEKGTDIKKVHIDKWLELLKE